MLGPRTRTLLSIGSDAAGTGAPSELPVGRVLDELADLLAERNGFYAFESALHVFGSGPCAVADSLEGWNSAAGWIASYEGLADGLFFFFAEDAFGAQFAVRGEEILTFDPETAEAKVMASSIEDWAD